MSGPAPAAVRRCAKCRRLKPRAQFTKHSGQCKRCKAQWVKLRGRHCAWCHQLCAGRRFCDVRCQAQHEALVQARLAHLDRQSPVRCAHCGDPVTFGTVDGRLVSWCPTDGETVVPPERPATFVRYDQGERRKAQLAQWLVTAQREIPGGNDD